MAWSLLLLTLLVHCTGSWAQSVLTQPSSVSGALGQRVTISCTGSSSNIGYGYDVHWSAVFTMAWTPVLLLLFSHFSGSLSEIVLTQPPSLSASLGASARLTCTLSSGFGLSNHDMNWEHSTYYIEWYQQQPGKAPWYVMQLKSDGSHSKGDGIPDRFSGSNSGADCYLTISDIQPEDEADYLCGEGHKIGVPFG
ncbi:Immunoglobulin iota chain [Tupaia chinensis]|nr:Immunoglobulin iota chain [Tupaia chinensis]